MSITKTKDVIAYVCEHGTVFCKKCAPMDNEILYIIHKDDPEDGETIYCDRCGEIVHTS